MNYKSLDGLSTSFKATNGDGEEAGTFEALVGVFNVPDRYREVIDPGFFTDSLKSGLPAVVWSHAWMTPPVGVSLSAVETEEGLLAKGRFFVRDEEKNPLAQQIYTAMSTKGGDGQPALREWSVGLNVQQESYEEHQEYGRITHLEKGECVEYGPCLKGINPETRTVALKADIRNALQTGSLPMPELLEVLRELQSAVDLKAVQPESDSGRSGVVNTEHTRAVAAVLF